MAPQAEKPAASRRKFLTGAAATAAGATAAIAAPNVSRAQTTTIKMQGAWAPQDILNEFAEDYVTRVNEMGGDRLQIDYLISGSVVKPFSIHDAVHQGVLQGGHTVPAYVYGKNKAASLFGTGPAFGWNAHQFLAWVNFGGGAELYQELMQQVLGFNVVSFFSTPMPTQPLGWYKNEVTGAADLQGMKFRTVGPRDRGVPEHGRGGDAAARRRDRPGHAGGRDRRLRVQQPELGPSARRARRRQELHARQLSSGERVLRDHLQQGHLRRAGAGAAGDPEVRERGGVLGDPVEGVRPLLEGPDRACRRRTASPSSRPPPTSCRRSSRPGIRSPSSSRPTISSGAIIESQRDWCKRVVFYDIYNSADYKLAYEHHFGPLGF